MREKIRALLALRENVLVKARCAALAAHCMHSSIVEQTPGSTCTVVHHLELRAANVAPRRQQNRRAGIRIA